MAQPCSTRNDGGNRNNWLSVRLQWDKSNRSGLDAVVRVESELGKQWKTVHSGSSYCSQSDLALTFGLAHDRAVRRLSIEWPSGVRQEFKNVAVNRFLTIDEARGILSEISRYFGACGVRRAWAGNYRAASDGTHSEKSGCAVDDADRGYI